MTDAASALRAAADCLFAPVGRWEIDEGIEWVAAAIAALPPGTNSDLVKMVETLDWRQIEMVADQLDRQTAPTPNPAQQPKPPRQRRARSAPPGGLRTMGEAAARLGCSIKTLNGHVATRALRYVNIGHGSKRPRKMFTDADLNTFIEAQTRKDSPCPPSATRARPTGSTTSSGEVVAFTARPKSRPSGKPKK
jgi:hypothetical protein